MTSVWALAALWLGLALIASLLSIWFRVSTALSEIVVGTIAQLVIGAIIGQAVLGTDESWIKFLSGIGAIVLTSALWGMYHTQYDWLGRLWIFVLGLALCTFRWRSGSTWLAVIVHSAINIFLLFMSGPYV